MSHAGYDKTTSAHQHPLIRMQNDSRRRMWICDFCLRESEDLRETFSYRCERCDFDLCFDCVQPQKHPAHVHALVVADIRSIYCSWFCNICKCTNKPDEILSRRCGECKFDVCYCCSQRHITQLHQHPLYRADSRYVYPVSSGRWICDNCNSHYDPPDNWPWHCYKCGYDLCGNCIGVTPGIKTDAENEVKKLVSPHFLSGLMSLENFVQRLDETPNDVSIIAVQRMMPSLLGLVKKSHEAFCIAESAVHQINDRMDKTLQIVVVEEKNANDSLRQTKESLAILERKVEVLEEERGELSDQLSKLDLNLKRDKESLRQRRKRLEQAERDRNKGTTLGAVLGGIFGGPLGALAGGAIADRVHSTDVSNAEQAVSEASSQVTNTKRSLAAKETELCELTNEQDEQEIYKRWTCQELELLKTRKEDIKESQRRLAKLNESIKNCTLFVDTTTMRAKMMADEAKGKLPDIEVMIPPLKAIAGDVAEASLSNSRLLSGRVDMKGIGTKIKMITSQRLKSITSNDVDQWA